MPRESPNGRYLYYYKVGAAEGLWRVPVDSGEEVRVLDGSKSWIGAVTDDGVYFINPGAKDGVAVEFWDFATSQQRRVAELGMVNLLPSALAISPDRRHVLYTQNDHTGSDIVLIENFH